MELYYWSIKGRNYELLVLALAGGLELTLKSDFVLSEIRDSLPFGQVPYLVDGELKLAQSQAILRYLARKGGIQGATDAEFAKSEMLIEETRDILTLMEKAVGSATKNTTYDELFAEDGAITKQLRFLEKLFVPDRATFVDAPRPVAGEYVLTCCLDAVLLVQPTALDAFPKLRRFFDHMFALPAFDGVKDLRMPAHFLRDP